MAEPCGETVTREACWIVALEGSVDPRYFGPFVDEEEALAWGIDNLADFEPEEWEPYEVTLEPPAPWGSA